jgi:hypothetical protein
MSNKEILNQLIELHKQMDSKRRETDYIMNETSQIGLRAQRILKLLVTDNEDLRATIEDCNEMLEEGIKLADNYIFTDKSIIGLMKAINKVQGALEILIHNLK